MFALISVESLTAIRQSLILMAQGMLGVFVFMAVFYLLIKGLSYLLKVKANGE